MGKEKGRLVIASVPQAADGLQILANEWSARHGFHVLFHFLHTFDFYSLIFFQHVITT